MTIVKSGTPLKSRAVDFSLDRADSFSPIFIVATLHSPRLHLGLLTVVDERIREFKQSQKADG